MTTSDATDWMNHPVIRSLVDQATKAVYEKVFSVFGVITLAVVGLYLIWRSQQADMGAATTTAGWAILIMVAVCAIS